MKQHHFKSHDLQENNSRIGNGRRHFDATILQNKRVMTEISKLDDSSDSSDFFERMGLSTPSEKQRITLDGSDRSESNSPSDSKGDLTISKSGSSGRDIKKENNENFNETFSRNHSIRARSESRSSSFDSIIIPRKKQKLEPVFTNTEIGSKKPEHLFKSQRKLEVSKFLESDDEFDALYADMDALDEIRREEELEHQLLKEKEKEKVQIRKEISDNLKLLLYSSVSDVLHSLEYSFPPSKALYPLKQIKEIRSSQTDVDIDFDSILNTTFKYHHEKVHEKQYHFFKPMYQIYRYQVTSRGVATIESPPSWYIKMLSLKTPQFFIESGLFMKNLETMTDFNLMIWVWILYNLPSLSPSILSNYSKYFEALTKSYSTIENDSGTLLIALYCLFALVGGDTSVVITVFNLLKESDILSQPSSSYEQLSTAFYIKPSPKYSISIPQSPSIELALDIAATLAASHSNPALIIPTCLLIILASLDAKFSMVNTCTFANFYTPAAFFAHKINQLLIAIPDYLWSPADNESEPAWLLLSKFIMKFVSTDCYKLRYQLLQFLSSYKGDFQPRLAILRRQLAIQFFCHSISVPCSPELTEEILLNEPQEVMSRILTPHIMKLLDQSAEHITPILYRAKFLQACIFNIESIPDSVLKAFISKLEPQIVMLRRGMVFSNLEVMALVSTMDMLINNLRSSLTVYDWYEQ